MTFADCPVWGVHFDYAQCERRLGQVAIMTVGGVRA